jgi:UDP-3-O-[3-hydroxymyristoyl] glucosamine N-acyltransferase
MPQVRLSEVVDRLGGELVGDAQLRIERLAPLQDADASALSFLSNPRYQAQLASSSAGCVIVSPAMREAAVARGAAIVTDDPYLYFARLTQWWAVLQRPAAQAGIHPSAVVEADAQVDASASVGPLAYIASGAQIGPNVVIGSHCHIGRHARIGADTRFAARVTLADGCVIGERGIVHPGVVIGADGFGFAPTQGRYEKIEQLGAVRIGDDVEIGANTCIDRGALGDTVIANGVKLDNLIQIGHNVQIGEHTAMAAFVGIAGSAKIGAHCTLGGASRIMGHIEVADNVHVSTCTFISRSIHKPGVYSGSFPFDDNASWEKNAATLRQLHSLRDRLRALEKKTT